MSIRHFFTPTKVRTSYAPAPGDYFKVLPVTCVESVASTNDSAKDISKQEKRKRDTYSHYI